MEDILSALEGWRKAKLEGDEEQIFLWRHDVLDACQCHVYANPSNKEEVEKWVFSALQEGGADE